MLPLQFANCFDRCLLRGDGVSLWSLGRKSDTAIGATSSSFNKSSLWLTCCSQQADHRRKTDTCVHSGI